MLVCMSLRGKSPDLRITKPACLRRRRTIDVGHQVRLWKECTRQLATRQMRVGISAFICNWPIGRTIVACGPMPLSAPSMIESSTV